MEQGNQEYKQTGRGPLTFRIVMTRKVLFLKLARIRVLFLILWRKFLTGEGRFSEPSRSFYSKDNPDGTCRLRPGALARSGFCDFQKTLPWLHIGLDAAGKPLLLLRSSLSYLLLSYRITNEERSSIDSLWTQDFTSF